MDYISSRGQASNQRRRSYYKGIAPDGGLFVPEYIPRLTEDIFWSWEDGTARKEPGIYWLVTA